jgi:hypothetical protein
MMFTILTNLFIFVPEGFTMKILHISERKPSLYDEGPRGVQGKEAFLAERV